MGSEKPKGTFTQNTLLKPSEKRGEGGENH